MDKKFAIFDMDGTLVDSMSFWKTLGVEYLKSRGVSRVPEDILEQIFLSGSFLFPARRRR